MLIPKNPYAHWVKGTRRISPGSSVHDATAQSKTQISDPGQVKSTNATEDNGITHYKKCEPIKIKVAYLENYSDTEVKQVGHST